MSSEDMDPQYAREVGQRLRDIRRQQGLSLQAVEDASSREFKASVLGAYERGERIISVLRLQRLGSLYNVPVDQLLPRDSTGRVGSADTDFGEQDEQSDQAPVKIDLARLDALEPNEVPERDILRRYVGMIQIQRGDFNGKVITIRNEDVRALARVFERSEAQMRARLTELGVRGPA